MSKMRIGIIGAGAAGLAAAWDFARAGHSVHIYEAAEHVGGLAAGFKDERWEWTLEKVLSSLVRQRPRYLPTRAGDGRTRPDHLPAPQDQLLDQWQTLA